MNSLLLDRCDFCNTQQQKQKNGGDQFTECLCKFCIFELDRCAKCTQVGKSICFMCTKHLKQETNLSIQNLK